METDPERMMELLLGIPGVRVLTVEVEPTGMQVDLETSAASAMCPICRNEAEPAGVEVVDLGVHSAMASPCISNGSSVSGAVRWRSVGHGPGPSATRESRSSLPGHPTAGRTVLSSDQSGLPA